MKKIGFIIFITALIIGVSLSNFFSYGESTEKIFNFSINSKVHGSGNIASEKRDIADFNAIKVSGVIQVEVTAQKDFSVEIEADDNLLHLIKSDVSGGVLHLETEESIKSKNPIRVRVSAPDIENLDTSGASKVSIVNLSNENLKIDSSGASKITVEGETINLTVDVSGASKIEAGNLKTENASVDASGASSVNIYAANELKADASGASSIIYEGNPKQAVKKSSGASSVRQK